MAGLLHDAIDDLFATSRATSVATVQTQHAEAEADRGSSSIVPLGPSLELYLDQQMTIRRSKTTWNSLDMCFRWQLVCAYFELEHPGLLDSDAALRARVQRLTRLNSNEAILYDPVLRRVTMVHFL